MVDLLVKVFDFFWSRKSGMQAKRRLFLLDLVGYCSESQAALLQFTLARQHGENEGRGGATISEFIELQRLGGVAQQLQLRVRSAFPEKDVQLHLFELLRRFSMTRQFLSIAEPSCLMRGFTADREWLDIQIRRALIVTAHAAGIDLSASDVPFLVDFNLASDIPMDGSDWVEQPPSSKIVGDHFARKAREKWEALGHEWEEEWGG